MTSRQPRQRQNSPFVTIADPTPGRRSFLQFGAAGIAAAVIAPRHGSGGSGQSTKQRETERLVRRFLHAIETGSTSAIWAYLARDGAIEFPFLGTRYTDLASFDADIGPLLAVLPGLTFSDPEFEFFDDPEALIAKYTGHAVVTFTGKSYDQTYISEIHTRRGKVTSCAEYFDTAVLNVAFTP